MNTVPFGRREVLWILNYLLTHDAILNNVHFVENVEKTDRGIRVVADGLGKEPLLLFIQAQEFTDPEQIFHEIRMNWRKALYFCREASNIGLLIFCQSQTTIYSLKP